MMYHITGKTSKQVLRTVLNNAGKRQTIATRKITLWCLTGGHKTVSSGSQKFESLNFGILLAYSSQGFNINRASIKAIIRGEWFYLEYI